MLKTQKIVQISRVSVDEEELLTTLINTALILIEHESYGVCARDRPYSISC